MATAARDDNLQCGLCLNRYKIPKLLPCHHSFCQGCIEGLVQNADGNPLRCPVCRENFTLPPGGVAALKTNFYIIPQLNHGLCKIHTAKPLEYFCQPCDIPLCLVCKLTEHEGHKTKALDDVVKQAREDLLGHQTRFEETEKRLTEQVAQVQETMNNCNAKHERFKYQVDNREELLLHKFKAVLAECKSEVLEELGTSFGNIAVPLQESKLHMEDNLTTVRELKQEVATALDDSNSTSLLTLTRDMSSGRGSQQQLQQLMSQAPDNNDQPVLQCTDDILPHDIIKKFLGEVGMFQPTAMTQSVKLQEAFRCNQDEESYVHAINFDVVYNAIYVAQGGCGPQGKGCVMEYSGVAYKVNDKMAVITGRVCLGGLNKGWVRAEGNEFKAKHWLAGCLLDVINANEREYDVYNKGHARFVVRVHTSGVCDFRSVKIGEYTHTTDSKVCELKVKNPVAMDVSKDNKILAVLEDDYKDVKIFHHGKSQPHAIYSNQGKSFKPLDLCFFTIGGEERLVIADWLNDALHVIDVSEGCKLIGHLGVGFPELVKPTALCPHPTREKQLWIGCQGGHILKLKYDYNDSDEDDDDDDDDDEEEEEEEDHEDDD